LFGSSRHLVVSADSATAAMLAAGLVGLAATGSAAYVALAGVLACMAAGFLLVARLLGLGFMADFLSRTVLIGFLTGVGIQVALGEVDVIVTTHKTIALVFPTQVYKLKRDMTHTRAVAASSRTFMQTDVMEVNDETPAHPPATDGGRPASVGAPSQGASDHSRTPGGPRCK